jgi:heat shock protein HslJ
MKNTRIIFVAVFLLSIIIFPLMLSASPSQEGGYVVSFNEVIGKEWMLADLRVGGNTITMDRVKLAADNMADVYSLTFNEGRVSGKAAPNRYFGPYTESSGKALNLGNIASTLMASSKVPDGLNETEYFAYLTRVTRWDLVNGKLELYSTDSNGTAAVLVFVRK